MKTKINKIQIAFSFCLVCLMQVFFAPPVRAQYKDSVTFQFKASEQNWTVPEGVKTIHINAYGAQGGSANGGKGGKVESDMKVTPGTKLIINVGSQPSGAEAGYNGGGKACGNGHGGGGATDIRIGGSGLEHRVLVAGGGGGAGYGGLGGPGGGTVGGDGIYDADNAAHIAKGGTQEAGGAGARAYFSPGGQIGVGGDGLNNRGDCSNGAMGAGGGGYYGGGGGGAGGGGGGSSYTNDSNSKVSHHQGVNEGNGKLVIYFTKG